MIYPPKLQPGDAVGIVAPARKITPGQVEAALETLVAWGLMPTLAKNIFSSKHSYLAGSDDERREDFQKMIDDENVKAIFCARGGYGSTRIIEELDFSPLKKSPKWIIGFSDITAFHLRLASIGIASIHGTMPIFFDQPEARGSVQSIHDILFKGSCLIEVNPEDSNRPGRASGQVVGGNLSLIVDALNTASEPDTRNKILVVEEVDEFLYKLDRMFTQLRRTGKLKDLSGLVIGHMTDLKNSDLAFGETASEIILHAVRDYDYPVAFSFPSGHRNPNLAWIHGATADLDVSLNKASLSYPDIYSSDKYTSVKA
ncbi:MAG TPA: LD-carboxypeptidase [Chryseosolibacter sp.]